jgi:hypothetical protein
MAGERTHTFRTAHKADFDHVERRPGYLYVRSRAISSRINENYDGFSAEEIKLGYKTFQGKPVFVSHHNENHRRARGAIVAVALHEDYLADKSPDTWVEVLMEVDAIKFPKLAQAIIAGEVARTSMGCDVQYSRCTFCGNKAYTEAEYCNHIPRLKGKKIRRVDAKTGASSMVLVAEECFGLNFFENSLLVEEPADPTAFVLGIDGMGVTASKTAYGWGDGPPDDPEESWWENQADYVHDAGGDGHTGDSAYDCPRCQEQLRSAKDDYDPPADMDYYSSKLSEGFILTVDGEDKRYHDTMKRAAKLRVRRALANVRGGRKRVASHRKTAESDNVWLVKDWTILAGPADFNTPAGQEIDRRAEAGEGELWGDETIGASVGLKDSRPTPDFEYLARKSFGGKRVASLHKSAAEKIFKVRHKESGDDIWVQRRIGFNGFEYNCGAGWRSSLAEAHRVAKEQGSLNVVKHAINETIAPPEVDTLRESECPICGSDAYNGEECPVCNFIKPPDMFMDPDLEAAQNADLRQDNAQDALQVSDQVVDNQEQTPVGELLGDGGVSLQCDNCGTSIPGSPQSAQADGTAPSGVPGAPGAPQGGPGAPPPSSSTSNAPQPPTPTPTQPQTQPGAEPPPPANDESMPLPTGKGDKDSVPPAGEKLPKPKDGENDDGQSDGSQATDGVDGKGAPSTPPSSDGTSNTDKGSADKSTQGKPGDSGKVSPDIDAGDHDGTKPKGNGADDGTAKPPTDDQAVTTLQHSLKPGDPCPVCDGKGKLQPQQDDAKDPSKGDSSDDPKDDNKKKSDGPPWLKDKNSSKGVKSSISQRHSGVSNMPQPTVKVLASQQAELRRLKAENLQLRRSVNYIASLIGITADVNDPAQPVPQPGGGAPSQTSEEVMNSATRVDVQQPGATPVNGVAADATETVDSVGGIKADTPYTINTEVTTPVAGTETRIPLDKVRTLPEIQFGNPNNPDTAFPLEGGPFAEKATLGAKGRTYAALRLARLRRAAGIETSGRDELVVANEIDRNASLSDQALGNEIETLSAVVSARQTPAPRQAARRLVPQSRNGVERTVPSVAVGESLPQFTSAAASDDDAFAFCE